MQALPPEPNEECGCVYDADTGYFNPCCLRHEQEYLDFMQTAREHDAEVALERYESKHDA